MPRKEESADFRKIMITGPFFTRERLLLVTRPEVLVGAVYLVAGVLVLWDATIRLDQMAQAYPDLSQPVPDRIVQWASSRLPKLLPKLISTAASLIGCVVGIIWIVFGIAGFTEAQKHLSETGDPAEPVWTAESIRTGLPAYWRAARGPLRAVLRAWPRARSISPVSFGLLGFAGLSILTFLFMILGLALAGYATQFLPGLLEEHFQVTSRIVIPSAERLFSLLGTLIWANGLIAASLLIVRKPEWSRTRESLAVRGGGDPRLFFALLEEAYRIFSAEGSSPTGPVRLEADGSSLTKGTLMESRPEPVPSLSRPAGILCLPVAVGLIVWGFSLLIHFTRPAAPSDWEEFLTRYLLDYGLELLTALALILAGGHFAEWARRLLGVQRFRSSMVFCSLSGASDTASLTLKEAPAQSWSPHPNEITWRVDQGGEDAKPFQAGVAEENEGFRAEVVWAQTRSESASTKGWLKSVLEPGTKPEPRYVIDVRRNQKLDDQMKQVLEIPFGVSFQKESHR